jgi:serine protease Do
VAALAGVLLLLGVAAAYAATSGSTGTRTPEPAAVTSTSPAWLGVETTNAPVRGAVVAKVVPGSPAAAAGIKPGDVITQLDTEPIETPAILVSAIAGMQPGDTVDIQVQRGASEQTVHVALTSAPARNP